jgi:hypothetical protein
MAPVLPNGSSIAVASWKAEPSGEAAKHHPGDEAGLEEEPDVAAGHLDAQSLQVENGLFGGCEQEKCNLRRYLRSQDYDSLSSKIFDFLVSPLGFEPRTY